MNTIPAGPTNARRLAAFSLALVMTLAMLGSMNHLATSDAPAAQLVRAEALQGART